MSCVLAAMQDWDVSVPPATAVFRCDMLERVASGGGGGGVAESCTLAYRVLGHGSRDVET